MEDERATGHDTLLSASLASPFVSHAEHQSNSTSSPATVSETVMAEQVTNDVVKEAQSVGPSAPIDDTASTTNSSAANGEQPSGPTNTNSNPSEAPSASTNATTTDSASAAGAQASPNTDGQAATVSMKVFARWVSAKTTRPLVTQSTRHQHPRTQATPNSMATLVNSLELSLCTSTAMLAAVQIQTSAARAAWTRRSRILEAHEQAR